MDRSTYKMRVVCALLIMLSSWQANAQDWKSVLKGVASAVEDKASEKIQEKTDTLMLIGNWCYERPDIQLESDDLLSKAGSEIASRKAEEHMVDVLTKLGINERTIFTFNNDSTYTIQTDKHTMKGTYSINKNTREITMTSQLKLNFTAVIDQRILKPHSLSLRFKAEKLMGLVKYVTGSLAQKSSNKSIALANSLLSKYDGLTLGFELKKQ